MTPAETWEWIDEISLTEVGDDDVLRDLRHEHKSALFDELVGGRQIVANVTVYGGIKVSNESGAYVNGCTFYLADKDTLTVPA